MPHELESPTPAGSTVELGSFALVRRIANGWLGPTYRGVEKPSALQAAVKVISAEFLRQPEARPRLAALATALASLPEPGVVNCLRCTEQSDGSVLFAMPFIECANLAELVSRQPGEAHPDALWIASQVAATLAAAHQAGLHHLALRPSQVLVSVQKDSERGIAVHLLGIGLVQALGLTGAAGLMGRDQVYVPPEQLAAETGSPLDERTDVFGLGVLLLHLLLGQQPTPEVLRKCQDNAAEVLIARVLSSDTARLIQAMLAVPQRTRPTLAEVMRVLGIESKAALLSATLAAPPGASVKTDPVAQTEGADLGTSHGSRDGAMPKKKIGPYAILGKLGEGGMGTVFEAVHELIERKVAIKVLHSEFAHQPELIARFFNEARVVNRIDHPGLVQISDYGQLPDKTAYIVMERLHGESLSTRIKQGGSPIGLHEALTFSSQIAQALAVVHEKGVIHRDLKPDNIMIVADSQVPGGKRTKLLDFGIAKMADDGSPAQPRTITNAIMGTTYYMSPEQCRGAGKVDSRTDVYALGVMLYEMLCGERPITGEGHGEIISRHLTQEPASLRSKAPQVPKPVAALVHRMLIKNREQRPMMQDVAAELESLLWQLPPSPSMRSAASQSRRAENPASALAPKTLTGTVSGQANQSKLGPRSLGLAAVPLAALILGGAFALRGQSTDIARVAPLIAANKLTSPPPAAALDDHKKIPVPPPDPPGPIPVVPPALVAGPAPAATHPSDSGVMPTLDKKEPLDSKPLVTAKVERSGFPDAEAAQLHAVAGSAGNTEVASGAPTAAAAPVAAPVEPAAAKEARRLNSLGDKAHAAKKYDQAIDLFHQAIDRDPSFAQAYSNLAVSYLQAGRIAEAIAANHKALGLATGTRANFLRAASYYNIASIYEKTGDFASALKNYELAQAERPIYSESIARIKSKLP